ncbi:unnamed protein product [Closterium sp. NIES-54]
MDSTRDDVHTPSKRHKGYNGFPSPTEGHEQQPPQSSPSPSPGQAQAQYSVQQAYASPQQTYGAPQQYTSPQQPYASPHQPFNTPVTASHAVGPVSGNNGIGGSPLTTAMAPPNAPSVALELTHGGSQPVSAASTPVRAHFVDASQSTPVRAHQPHSPSPASAAAHASAVTVVQASPLTVAPSPSPSPATGTPGAVAASPGGVGASPGGVAPSPGGVAASPGVAGSMHDPPCAACKSLRRKCTRECIFLPYFPRDDPEKFARVHKVFGASNVSKMLQVSPTGCPHPLPWSHGLSRPTFILPLTLPYPAVGGSIGKLADYAAGNPDRIPKIVAKLEERAIRELRAERALLAWSVLSVVQKLLQSKRVDVRVLGSDLLADFVDCQSDAAYAASIQKLCPTLVAMAHEAGSQEDSRAARSSALRAIAAVVSRLCTTTRMSCIVFFLRFTSCHAPHIMCLLLHVVCNLSCPMPCLASLPVTLLPVPLPSTPPPPSHIMQILFVSYFSQPCDCLDQVTSHHPPSCPFALPLFVYAPLSLSVPLVPSSQSCALTKYPSANFPPSPSPSLPPLRFCPPVTVSLHLLAAVLDNYKPHAAAGAGLVALLAAVLDNYKPHAAGAGDEGAAAADKVRERTHEALKKLALQQQQQQGGGGKEKEGLHQERKLVTPLPSKQELQHPEVAALVAVWALAHMFAAAVSLSSQQVLAHLLLYLSNGSHWAAPASQGDAAAAGAAGAAGRGGVAGQLLEDICLALRFLATRSPSPTKEERRLLLALLAAVIRDADSSPALRSPRMRHDALAVAGGLQLAHLLLADGGKWAEGGKETGGEGAGGGPGIGEEKREIGAGGAGGAVSMRGGPEAASEVQAVGDLLRILKRSIVEEKQGGGMDDNIIGEGQVGGGVSFRRRQGEQPALQEQALKLLKETGRAACSAGTGAEAAGDIVACECFLVNPYVQPPLSPLNQSFSNPCTPRHSHHSLSLPFTPLHSSASLFPPVTSPGGQSQRLRSSSAVRHSSAGSPRDRAALLLDDTAVFLESLPSDPWGSWATLVAAEAAAAVVVLPVAVAVERNEGEEGDEGDEGEEGKRKGCGTLGSFPDAALLSILRAFLHPHSETRDAAHHLLQLLLRGPAAFSANDRDCYGLVIAASAVSTTTPPASAPAAHPLAPIEDIKRPPLSPSPSQLPLLLSALWLQAAMPSTAPKSLCALSSTFHALLPCLSTKPPSSSSASPSSQSLSSSLLQSFQLALSLRRKALSLPSVAAQGAAGRGAGGAGAEVEEEGGGGGGGEAEWVIGPVDRRSVFTVATAMLAGLAGSLGMEEVAAFVLSEEASSAALSNPFHVINPDSTLSERRPPTSQSAFGSPADSERAAAELAGASSREEEVQVQLGEKIAAAVVASFPGHSVEPASLLSPATETAHLSSLRLRASNMAVDGEKDGKKSSGKKRRADPANEGDPRVGADIGTVATAVSTAGYAASAGEGKKKRARKARGERSGRATLEEGGGEKGRLADGRDEAEENEGEQGEAEQQGEAAGAAAEDRLIAGAEDAELGEDAEEEEAEEGEVPQDDNDAQGFAEADAELFPRELLPQLDAEAASQKRIKARKLVAEAAAAAARSAAQGKERGSGSGGGTVAAAAAAAAAAEWFQAQVVANCGRSMSSVERERVIPGFKFCQQFHSSNPLPLPRPSPPLSRCSLVSCDLQHPPTLLAAERLAPLVLPHSFSFAPLTPPCLPSPLPASPPASSVAIYNIHSPSSQQQPAPSTTSQAPGAQPGGGRAGGRGAGGRGAGRGAKGGSESAAAHVGPTLADHLKRTLGATWRSLLLPPGDKQETDKDQQKGQGRKAKGQNQQQGQRQQQGQQGGEGEEGEQWEAGSPVVLIVSASAVRCVDLLRACKGVGRGCRVAKLFAKHLKVEEQVEMLKGPVHVAAGTPNRGRGAGGRGGGGRGGRGRGGGARRSAD